MLKCVYVCVCVGGGGFAFLPTLYSWQCFTNTESFQTMNRKGLLTQKCLTEWSIHMLLQKLMTLMGRQFANKVKQANSQD